MIFADGHVDSGAKFISKTPQLNIVVHFSVAEWEMSFLF